MDMTLVNELSDFESRAQGWEGGGEKKMGRNGEILEGGKKGKGGFKVGGERNGGWWIWDLPGGENDPRSSRIEDEAKR